MPKKSEIHYLYRDALENKYKVFFRYLYDNGIGVAGTSFYATDTQLKISGIYILTNDQSCYFNL